MPFLLLDLASQQTGQPKCYGPGSSAASRVLSGSKCFRSFRVYQTRLRLNPRIDGSTSRSVLQTNPPAHFIRARTLNVALTAVYLSKV